MIEAKVVDRIINIVAGESVLDVIGHMPVSLDSNLIDDLGADSLDLTDAAMLLEKEFSIIIDTETIESWIFMVDIVNTVSNKFIREE